MTFFTMPSEPRQIDKGRYIKPVRNSHAKGPETVGYLPRCQAMVYESSLN